MPIIAALIIPVSEALSALIQYLAPTANNDIATGVINMHSLVLSYLTEPYLNLNMEFYLLRIFYFNVLVGMCVFLVSLQKSGIKSPQSRGFSYHFCQRINL